VSAGWQAGEREWPVHSKRRCQPIEPTSFAARAHPDTIPSALSPPLPPLSGTRLARAPSPTAWAACGWTSGAPRRSRAPAVRRAMPVGAGCVGAHGDALSFPRHPSIDAFIDLQKLPLLISHYGTSPGVRANPCPSQPPCLRTVEGSHPHMISYPQSSRRACTQAQRVLFYYWLARVGGGVTVVLSLHPAGTASVPPGRC
jgi:hypothetical protein